MSNVRRCDAFFVDLHNLFLDICELYVDIVVDKDGHSSKVDEMSKQQIYFLTVEPDDFSEILKRPSTSKEGDGRRTNCCRIPSNSELVGGSALGNVDEAMSDHGPVDSPGSKRPFQFSDFKKQPVRPESPNVSDCSGGGRRDSTSAMPDDPDDDVFKTAAAGQEEVAQSAKAVAIKVALAEITFKISGVPRDDPERVRLHDERVQDEEGEADVAVAGLVVGEGGQRLGQPRRFEGSD